MSDDHSKHLFILYLEIYTLASFVTRAAFLLDYEPTPD
jgi:hypothetical protein